jgi:hypothetical protein
VGVKILHLLNDGPDSSVPEEILEVQAEEHEVEVLDLTHLTLSYEELIERIFAADKVMSW